MGWCGVLRTGYLTQSHTHTFKQDPTGQDVSLTSYFWVSSISIRKTQMHTHLHTHTHTHTVHIRIHTHTYPPASHLSEQTCSLKRKIRSSSKKFAHFFPSEFPLGLQPRHDSETYQACDTKTWSTVWWGVWFVCMRVCVCDSHPVSITDHFIRAPSSLTDPDNTEM